MKIALVTIFSFFLFCSNVFAQRQDSLRIITYNIHHAETPAKPGTIDIEAIVSSLKKYPADIIALQEVDVNTKRSGNINEAQLIAEKLNMYSFFARAIDYDGGQYGVALLSRFLLKDTQVIFLPMDTIKKGEQRVLATATLTLRSGRTLLVGCTHLDHRQDPKSRELQVAEITAFTKTRSIPFVLAGDFNAEPASGEIRLFDETFQRTCAICPPTFPAIYPAKTIDHIAYKKMKGIKVVSHQVLPEPFASDHLPLRVVIKFQ